MCLNFIEKHDVLPFKTIKGILTYFFVQYNIVYKHIISSLLHGTYTRYVNNYVKPKYCLHAILDFLNTNCVPVSHKEVVSGVQT